MTDNFNGDTPHLIRCIEALLKLDADKALVPHGIPGHARTLLEAAAVRLSAEPVAEVVAGTENFGAVQFTGPIPPKGTKLYTHGVGAAPLAQQWRDAYAAFKGAFDTPQMRRQMPDEFSSDARSRLREFDEAFRAHGVEEVPRG